MPLPVNGISNVVSVSAAGGDFTLGLKSDGTVWTWGSPYYAPVQVSGLSYIVGVSAGYDHMAAVKSDGTVWTWGSNGNGQLGDGSTTNSSIPIQVPGLANVVQVAAGRNYTLALKSDGTVWAWGNNGGGQLGDGTTTQSLIPVWISSLTDMISIAADTNQGRFSLALKDDGTVWGWGDNHVGQLGDGTNAQRLTPVPTGLSGVIAIDADLYCGQAVKADGTLWAWGYNPNGQLGDGTKVMRTSPVPVGGLTNVTAAALGHSHGAAIRSDGAVFSWGDSTYGQLGDDNISSRTKAVEIPGIDNVAKTASGAQHVLALKEDGAVWSWGANYYGELGDNTLLSRSVPAPVPGLANVIAVAGGSYFSLALKADGSVWSWGYNQQGQLGHDNYAHLQSPAAIAGLTGVIAISSTNHSIAVKSNGTVWTWGTNWSGQIGDNSIGYRLAPVHVTGVSGITAAAAGGKFSLVLKSDGTVWAWGENSSGQLGNGTTTSSLTPVPVSSNLSDVVAIACGFEHSLALKSDGTVWGWGHNGHGQLDDGTTTNRSTPAPIPGLSGIVSIVAGAYHSAAVKADGSMWSKGNNWGNELGDGSTEHRIKQVSAGGDFNLAVKENGNLIAWGSNVHGTHGVGMPIHPNAMSPVLVPGVNVQEDAPSVAIASPASNTSVALGQAQTVTVDFTPGDGSAQSVSLYYYGILVGTDGSAPYTFTFTPWTWGDFELHAVGLDSNGVYSKRSPKITIHTPYDSDFDRLPDWWEQKYFNTLAVASTGDVDADGLTNAQEMAGGTTPNSWDSDGDGYSDGFEVAKGKDPLGGESFPALAHAPGIKRIVAGFTHTVAVREDGTVWAWGHNGHGSVSDGPTSWQWPHLESVPVRVGSLTGVTSVAAGPYHNLALKSDGTVWAWGSFSGGLFGDGTTNASATPGQITSLSGITAVAAGDAHTVALKSDGTVVAWGSNGSGQVGDGSTTQRLSPVPVSGLTGIVAVAAAENHSLAVKNDGTVWAWGANGTGQLGDGTTTQRSTPVQVSGGLTGVTRVACRSISGYAHSVALKSDGTVWAWGNNAGGQLGDGTKTQRLAPVQVSGLSGIVEIDAGAWGTMALKSDGTMWAWGTNEAGQLGDGTTTDRWAPVQIGALSNVVAIAAGYSHSGAVTADGKVHKWGRHVEAQLGDDSTFVSSAPIQSSSVLDVKHVAIGSEHAVTVKNDGTVWTCGYNGSGQLGDGTVLSKADPHQVAGLTSATMAGAGAWHSMVLKSDGTVWSWGDNRYGQLGDGTTTNNSAPVQASGLSSVVQIAAGTYHCLALKSDGTVRAWGNNGTGQLGDNSTTLRPNAVQVSNLTNVIFVAGGADHSMALKSDGTVWAWGNNAYGQLGNGTTTSSSVPVPVSGLTNVVAIACGSGYGFSMAVKSDGTLWTWGSNVYGNLGDGTYTARSTPYQISGVTNAVAVSGGSSYSLALKADGDIWSAGPPGGFQIGDGSTGHHSKLIAAGASIAAAVKEDGVLQLWGTGNWGQLGEAMPWNRETYSPIQVKKLNLLYDASELEITSPSLSPATVVLGQSQSLTVGVTPGDSQPETVSLYHHGVLVGTDATPPYTFNFTPWTWGDFELRAIGTDPLGLDTARSTPVIIHVPGDSDRDGDGLPEWWEARHFKPYLGGTGEGGDDDPDHDGLTNLYEYTHGTNPVEFNYAQTPQLLVVSGDGQNAAKGEVFARTLKVQVKTPGGTPIAYGEVGFAVDVEDGLLSGKSAAGWHGSVTVAADGEGYAEVWLLAGQTVGPINVTASAGGASTGFSATVTESADSPSLPWLPEGGYIIGNQTRTGSLTPVPSAGTWNVATTAQGFGGASESVYWLPRPTGRSAVLEWISDASFLQGVGDVSGIMMRLSDENTANQPFVFVGVRKATSTPTFAVELAWRSEEGGALRRIADLELPGGAFTDGMRFRLELIGGRVLLSCARPAISGPGFQPWQQRMAFELGPESIWKTEAAPSVFAGMAFASGNSSSASFVIGEHETRLEANRPGARWWRIVEPADEFASQPETYRLGTQEHDTQIFTDAGPIHEGLAAEPVEPIFWHPDYWHGDASSSLSLETILELNSVAHPIPTEYVDVYWKAGPVDDDGTGLDTARPNVTLSGEFSPSVELNQVPSVGGGSPENGTWVYLGRFPGSAVTSDPMRRLLNLRFYWPLQATGPPGSLSKWTFDGLLLVGGTTQPDTNGNQIPDTSPSDSALTHLGDWDGDGWTDAEEFYLGSDAQISDTTLAEALTFAIHATSQPVPLPRGLWSPRPLAVKVTYDSAGTRPVRGYGVDFSLVGNSKAIGFAGGEGQFPSWSSLATHTDVSGIARAYVWTPPDCAIPAGAGTYQVNASTSATSNSSSVTFTVRPYDNHAPLAIDATSQNMSLARTSTFPFATNGNALAAAGSWLASGDSLGIISLLPQLPGLTLPSLSPSVILWRWNSHSGGSWEATQYVMPDSPSEDSFGGLIAMDANPDPAMKASALMAVAAPEQGKIYLYALSQDGTAWRRWPTANAAISTGGTNISSIALQGRWLAVGDATASSGRGKVDLFKFQSSESSGNLTWTLPSSPSVLNPGGSDAQDAFGTSVSFSETGHRLVVGAPSNKDPAFPGATGLADPSVYVYEPASGGASWQQLTPTIQNTGSLGTGQAWADWARFGEAVLAVGDHVIVGAPIANSALAPTVDLYLTLGQPDGAVAAYKRNGSAWETAGLHVKPQLTFGWKLARGTDLVYASAKTMDVYVVGGNVVVTSAEDSDPLDPLSAFVQSFGFDTNGDLAEMPGGEILPGSLYPDDVPLAADATSVFVLHSNAQTGADTFAEYRWLPEVSRSAALNTTVAALSVEDMDWNNVNSLPFENISLDILATPTPWSLAGPTNGMWALRVGSTSLLAASPPGLAFVELEATDVAGEQHTELVALKLSSNTLVTPDILSGKWLSPTFVQLAWSPAAVDTDSYQLETAVLDGSPSPTFDQVAQIDGAVNLYQFEVVTNEDGYRLRVRARRGDDLTGYSDIFDLPYDSDSDGLPDWWEQMMGSDLEATDNPDGDGWDNAAELAHGTNPYAADSDGDGIPDHLDAEPLDRNSNVPRLIIHTVLQH